MTAASQPHSWHRFCFHRQSLPYYCGVCCTTHSDILEGHDDSLVDKTIDLGRASDLPSSVVQIVSFSLRLRDEVCRKLVSMDNNVKPSGRPPILSLSQST